MQLRFATGPRRLFGTSVDRPLLGINICAAAVHDIPAWKSLAVKDSERDFGKRMGTLGNTSRTPETTGDGVGRRLYYLVMGPGCAYASQ